MELTSTDCQYVLITGASAGLGEEYAYQLAQKGFSLILVARREQRLIELKKKLLTSYADIDVRYLCCDLTMKEGPQYIFDYIKEESINLIALINNAGFGLRGRFSEAPIKAHLDILQVNINALVTLTYLAIPVLQQQTGSFIINVASTAAFQAGPNVAIYYASKAFVLSFTEALHEELKEQNIQVSALCPGATKTEFAAVAGMSDSLLFTLRAMSKAPVVKASLANINKAVLIPGMLNKITALFSQLAPRSWGRKIAFLLQK